MGRPSSLPDLSTLGTTPFQAGDLAELTGIPLRSARLGGLIQRLRGKGLIVSLGRRGWYQRAEPGSSSPAPSLAELFETGMVGQVVLGSAAAVWGLVPGQRPGLPDRCHVAIVGRPPRWLTEHHIPIRTTADRLGGGVERDRVRVSGIERLVLDALYWEPISALYAPGHCVWAAFRDGRTDAQVLARISQEAGPSWLMKAYLLAWIVAGGEESLGDVYNPLWRFASDMSTTLTLVPDPGPTWLGLRRRPGTARDGGAPDDGKPTLHRIGPGRLYVAPAVLDGLVRAARAGDLQYRRPSRSPSL